MQFVAAKEMILTSQKQLKHIQEERRILGRISDHPNIIKMRYALLQGDVSYIMMDFEPGGDLFTFLRRYKITLSAAAFYSSQIVLALEHLHSLHVLHRDVKPENILLDEVGNLKLADFGLARLLENGEKTFTICGTASYLAPEMLAGVGYSYSVDIWMVACLIFELFIGRSPFYCNSDSASRCLIKECLVHYPVQLPFKAKTLVSQIFVQSPNCRLAYESKHWERIKQSDFFEGIEWDKVLSQEIKPPLSTVSPSEDVLQNFDEEFLTESCDFTLKMSENRVNQSLLGFDYCRSYPEHLGKTPGRVLPPPCH